MKQFFLNFLALFFPWIALLIYDNPMGAFLALVMQVTIVGWIPASIWAWQTVHPHKRKKEAESEQE